MIDLIFLLLMILALYKGLRRGLIIAIFSIIGWIIGLAAAIKLSAVMAGYLKGTFNLSAKWLPVLSFIAVFVIVLLLIRLGAKLIEKSAELFLLGGLNKIGGALLYAVIYTLIFSVFLFYAVQMKLINENTIMSSITYQWIQPLGPMVINATGKIIPIFRNMFKELEDFFAGLSKQIPPTH